MKQSLSLLLLLVACTLDATSVSAAVPLPGAAFETPIKLESLDAATFAEWCDGTEKKIEGNEKIIGPQSVIWTASESPGNSGLAFGDSKQPGPRHLRVGFHDPAVVGTLMTRGGGRPSILKPGVDYPGDLNNEDHWLGGQRLQNGKLTGEETDREEFALWVFPAGTKTRALRFTHVPKPTDSTYGGWLGSALVMENRFSNAAPQAIASTGANEKRAKLLNNGKEDGWGAWENREKNDPASAGDPIVSAEHPQSAMLTWPEPVKLSGLVALWAGFGSAEVQTYKGAKDRHPRDSRDEDWETVATFSGVKHGYSSQLWPNRLDFGREIATRAIRLRMTEVGKEGPHLTTNGGKRVWLGELMALESLGNAPLEATRTATTSGNDPTAPIAVRFSLKEPGFVTLVIENKTGFRVRNLISETWFPAGENVTWWDGLDDLGRDVDAARHGIYKIPAKLVEPGEYRVRGLVRGAIDPRYEFSVYTTGNPPWSTPDHTGAWLANHSPPIAAAFVPAKQSPTGQPAVFLGCYVTEGPDGMAWVDLEGRKLGGKKWIGGTWTAAPYLAADAGSEAIPGVSTYVGSVWETGKKSGVAELRITAIQSDITKPDKPVLVETLGELEPKADKGAEIGGLAVHNAIAVVSLTKKNELLFVYAKTGKVLGRTPLESPRGLAFDAKGRLLAISGTKLIRYDSIANPAQLPAPQTLISSGLEAPVGLTLDGKENIFVSDRGDSHQVKAFSPEGKFVRAIGSPGVPKAGPYDPQHLNNPAGIAVDSNQQLWVTENDFLPKRVSVWTTDGKLLKSFFGPGKYGGGGSLDPRDKTRFYYADEGHGAMEFKLDWAAGTSVPVNVYFRAEQGNMPFPFRSAGPETALYHNDRRYFTNCYNSNPTGGHPTAILFCERNGIAKPAAAMGRADAWDLLKTDAFKPRWPEGVDLNGKGEAVNAFFVWSDSNEDAQVQPEEVALLKDSASGVTVMDDLSFCVARVGDKAMRFAPVSFSENGTPRYDIAKGQTLAEGVIAPASSGGNQMLAAPDGWAVVTLGMKPFDARSFSGAKDGKPMWSYPNLWPGLHASHEAPLPGRPGELNGPTRLLGGLFEPKGSGAGPLWAVNCNHGNIYIFTTDGLFVATLFKDMREGKKWSMPVAERNMRLDGISLGEENFWPTLSQTSDGLVYLVDGARSSLVRLDGLNTVTRLPESPLAVTKADLEKCNAYLVESESARQRAQGSGILEVSIRPAPPVVDGKSDDWTGARFADIDKRGVKANFNSKSKPYDVTGALAVAGDRLYALYRTAGEDQLLKNTGEMPIALFKTGGALDLMIGTNPSAKPDRREPVPGDMRLLVTTVKGMPRAMLYRASVPGTPEKEKVPFSSPSRTITFDKVEDVSAQIEFAAKDGTYEFSIPLNVLGLKPADGLTIKGDIGILRGTDGQTTARTYWANKASGITADVPSEATLTPGVWGTFHFQTAK